MLLICKAFFLWSFWIFLAIHIFHLFQVAFWKPLCVLVCVHVCPPPYLSLNPILNDYLEGLASKLWGPICLCPLPHPCAKTTNTPPLNTHHTPAHTHHYTHIHTITTTHTHSPPIASTGLFAWMVVLGSEFKSLCLYRRHLITQNIFQSHLL